MGCFFNLSILITLLSFYCGAGYADCVSLTPTITGSFSIVYPTDIDSDSNGTPTSLFTSPFVSQTRVSITANPTGLSTKVSATMPPSDFVTVLDNSTIVASLIVFIIVITISVAAVVHVIQLRRHRKSLLPLSQPPAAYKTALDSTRSSLSIKGVYISPLGTPSTPSPVLSVSSRAPSQSQSSSEFLSSDIHHVQREMSASLAQKAASRRHSDASRSSLGTAKTVTRPSSVVWSAYYRAVAPGGQHYRERDVKAGLGR
ncbi:hypothetical protein C8R44DRAFT_213012 [Mycena epipterygia]|nr:hypothetical protein C8R44DRAFT_213012 [Mycena epipterygia]